MSSLSTKHFGIVGLGLPHEPEPGMATSAASFTFPSDVEDIHVSNTIARVVSGDQDLYVEVLTAARRLLERGASVIGTSCGYFSVFQQRLESDLGVAVFSSALAQVSLALAQAPAGSKVVVVWAVENDLVPIALAAIGVDPTDERLVHVDMGGQGEFRDTVLEHTRSVDTTALTAQVIEKLTSIGVGHETVSSVVFECGDLSVCSAAVRKHFPWPVYDYVTYFETGARSVGITG